MACYFLGPVGWNRRERDAMVPSADWRYSSDGSAKPLTQALRQFLELIFYSQITTSPNSVSILWFG
jgi:hypothetical protein